MRISTPNKVVSLNGLGRERSPGRRILGECRDQLVESLSTWLRDIAAPVAEELFHLADSTRERIKQTRYLDLRADVEKEWPQLVDAFRRDLASEAERCQSLSSENTSNRAAPLEVPDFEGLQLIADEDLSEHIVIREFAAQLSETCDAELYALDRRVAALLGQDEPVEGTNPLAPPVICQALTDACTTLGADAEDRLILLRRLERHLHLALPPIYQQLNGRLIERGILPDLKRSYRRSSAAVGTSTTPLPNDNPAVPATVQNAAPVSGEGILDVLQRLVQARTGGYPLATGTTTVGTGMPAATTNAPQGAAPDAATLSHLFLASLNQMQHEALAEAGNATVNQVRIVRDSEAAQQVGHLEAVTIDIVAMLFDFIFDDRDIPAAIKALISRLQIPVLKVAILDHDFFSDRNHPARRFLSSISGIAVRWGSAVDESDPFYGKLAELVARIQDEFESDVGVFGTALSELDAFVDERESEEESTVLATADVVVRHEQEADAWDRAQQAVRVFRTRPLPALIDHFLAEQWTPALQKVALQHDAASAAWQSATGTMAELAWSIEAKNSQDDRLKLISLLPRLLTQLNKGLDSIDASAEERRVFFDELVEYHSSALKGEARGVPVATITPTEQAACTPPVSNTQEGDLLVTRSIDHGLQVEEVILVGASPIWRADDREAFRLVSELKRGDWVEFRQDDGSTSRERLTWISPQRGLLVFSNHRSAKAISISPEALARQLRDDNAAIVRDEPLFERALSGVLESLNAA
jgi:hypothetical protein